MKLFKSLILPISSYGCEVWSVFYMKGLNNENLIQLCDKPTSENLHIMFSKYILGVNRKAPNAAVRASWVVFQWKLK